MLLQYKIFLKTGTHKMYAMAIPYLYFTFGISISAVLYRGHEQSLVFRAGQRRSEPPRAGRQCTRVARIKQTISTVNWHTRALYPSLHSSLYTACTRTGLLYEYKLFTQSKCHIHNTVCSSIRIVIDIHASLRRYVGANASVVATLYFRTISPVYSIHER